MRARGFGLRQGLLILSYMTSVVAQVAKAVRGSQVRDTFWLREHESAWEVGQKRAKKGHNIMKSMLMY